MTLAERVRLALTVPRTRAELAILIGEERYRISNALASLTAKRLIRRVAKATYVATSPGPRPPTMTSIADEHGVNVSTMSRRVKRLREAGLPQDEALEMAGEIGG